MPGTQYVALSSMRSRLDELDRLAADIANVGTPGYKGQRSAQRAAERPSFGAELQTAIDSVATGTKIDFTPGMLTPTGRGLDAAIDGPGFFVVETDKGPRYTRDGHFSKSAAGTLVASDGSAVQGVGGTISVGPGDVRIDDDGTVYVGDKKAGQLSVVKFDDPNKLSRDKGAMFRNDAGLTPTDVDKPQMHGGSLEGSNVSVSERLAQLTDVSRSFENLQKSISMVMNDVEGKTIETLGRR